MKKVKRLLAAALMVLTVLSVNTFSASASSSVVASNMPLKRDVGIAFFLPTHELYFKLYYRNTGTASLTPIFTPVSGTLSSVKAPMSSGIQMLYFRKASQSTEVLIQFYQGSGTVTGTYSIRRASTIGECGTW